jgi:hypothetical protein
MRTGVKRAQALPSKNHAATWSQANCAGSSLFRYLPLRDKKSILCCVFGEIRAWESGSLYIPPVGKEID